MQTGTGAARDREVLARAAPADDVHGRQLRAVELCNVPDMSHVGEVCFRDFDGERFDLAGPQRHNAVMDGRQREASYSIEKTSHGDNSHFAAATTVRAILTALCAV